MLFSSTVFLYLFLPVVLLFYYILCRKNRFLQNLVLLISSLLFYAWGEPKFVLIMIMSIIVNWLFGMIISGKRKDKIISRLILTLSVVFNIGLLFIFKYLTFAGTVMDAIFECHLSIPEIILPIGISFFTFQGMSYVFDVYSEKGKAQTNILYLGLYIAFFPQLIAGPIVRYETVANEIKNRKENFDDFMDGFARFVVGLSKKVLLANSFAILADQAFDFVKNGNTVSVMFGWLGALAYTFQIFFDFGGYSDMAIGLGRMFGFHFLENFNYPYISTSITEFWRRWHISLGTWFRDYLYIPLGGNRCNKLRNVFNLFIVWLSTGLWHGANVTFILWGLMYFTLLIIERITGMHKKNDGKLIVLKWLYTMLFVILGWVLFRAETVNDACVYLYSMFGLNGNRLVDGMFYGWFSQNILLLVIGALMSTPVFHILYEKTKDSNTVGIIRMVGLMVLFVFSVANLVSSSYNPFIYFNF